MRATPSSTENCARSASTPTFEREIAGRVGPLDFEAQWSLEGFCQAEVVQESVRLPGLPPSCGVAFTSGKRQLRIATIA